MSSSGQRSQKSSLSKKDKAPERHQRAPSDSRGSGGKDKRVSFSSTIQERGDTITTEYPPPVSVFSRNWETHTKQEPKTTRETSLREFFEFDWKRSREIDRQETRKKRLEKGFKDCKLLIFVLSA